jgi:hypothetical protein
MILGIQGLALDRHENMTGLNRLLLSKPFHLDNWIFNGYTDMNKQLKKKLAHFRFLFIYASDSLITF